MGKELSVVKQHLVQQQTIQRKLNQSLIQSIQMLQFTSVELYEYINEIAEENPLIEEVVYDAGEHQQTYQASDTYSIDAMNSSEKTLYERLKEQLLTIDIPEELLPTVEFGIDSLNENGYLEISLEEWASACNTTYPITEKALHIIQQLEPRGIGARHLGECIYLQLREMDGYRPFIEDLLLHHLDWIADYDWTAIQESYGITQEELDDLIKLIQSCDPKPGKLLDTTEVEYIVPEAKIWKDQDKWKITFYHWSAPKLVIDSSYNQLVDKEAERFLKSKRDQLRWLEGALKYRTATIELVIREIVERQVDFFEFGLLHLKSMTLSDIADKLELHTSTISRAVNNKYVETPHGIYPLKFFFQSGVSQDDDGKKTTIVLKHMIHRLIEEEDKARPLSDERIRSRLQEKYSVNIARRTVMKYRQELNIPASYKRRKE